MKNAWKAKRRSLSDAGVVKSGSGATTGSDPSAFLVVAVAGWLAVTCCPGCTGTPDDGHDLLGVDRGIESPIPGQPGYTKPERVDREFLPFSQAFQKDGDEYLFRVPQGTPSLTHRFTGLGPIEVRGMHRYSLSVRANLCVGGNSITLSATFLQAGTPILCSQLLTLYRHPTQKYAARMEHREIDFATPPNADQMVFWIGARTFGRESLGRKQAVFGRIRITRLGRMNGTAETQLEMGRDLLRAGDFEDWPPGPSGLAERRFVGGKGVRAEIVDTDSRCLHITMDRGGDKFVRFHTPTMNFDNCWVECAFRIKGKGTVTPGIWWRLAGNMWDYWHDHRRQVRLTDAWQRVAVSRYCVDPGTRFAAVVFSVQSAEADFFIDDLTFRVPGTEPKPGQIRVRGTGSSQEVHIEYTFPLGKPVPGL